MLTYEEARATLVSTQLLPYKITDPRILEAFAKVPRENYVGAAHSSLCYSDETLDVMPGRPLWPALFLARLLQEAKFDPTAHMLNIGFGTGYASAILSQLVDRITCLENDSARVMPMTALTEFCLVEVVYGPLAHGWPAAAPFDGILINGAIEMIPEALQNQIKEGGQLMTFFRAPQAKIAQGRLYRRLSQGWQHAAFFEADIAVWTEFKQQTGFQL